MWNLDRALLPGFFSRLRLRTADKFQQHRAPIIHREVLARRIFFWLMQKAGLVRSIKYQLPFDLLLAGKDKCNGS